MGSTLTERALLSAYLRAYRAFGRAPAGPEWRRGPLSARWADWVGAGEDLRDHVLTEGEVESRKHFVKLGPDGELRVVRSARVGRFAGGRRRSRAA